MVTKSAVMNKLVTPSISSSSFATGLSPAEPLTYVVGGPTGSPTANFMALGFGVGDCCTGIGF